MISHVNDEQPAHWDLSRLFMSPADPALQQTISEVERATESIALRLSTGGAGLLPDELVHVLETIDDVEASLGRLSAYAFLAHVDDHRSPTSARLMTRVEVLRASFQAQIALLDSELTDIDDQAFSRLLSEERIRPFAQYLRRRRVRGKHRLTGDQERLLASLSPMGRLAWDRLAADTLMRTKVVVDGRSLTLTESHLLRREPDRDLRRRASEAMAAAFDSNLGLWAYILNTLLLEKNLTDTIRRYPNWLSARNEENEVSDRTVEAMVATVASRFDLVQRYYRAKRELLGLDKLFDWDRFVGVAVSRMSVPWSDARRLVTNGYAAFSPRLAELVHVLFEQGVIDGVNRDRSGGFCQYTAPGLPPYISLNYTGAIGDVLTLGHELGHGVHILLSGERNRAVYYEPPQVLSETASLFGESLVLRELLRDSDQDSRAAVLCRQVEQLIDMVFRNVAYHGFEGDLYHAREHRGELSAGEISELWLQHNARLYGDSVELTPAYEPLWAMVSHIFRFPGYLYAYSFGNLLALGLLARWEVAGANFAERYIDFLAAGGSIQPPLLASQAGVDIERAGFWNDAIDYIETKVAEVEAIVRSAPRPSPSP